MNFSKLSFGGFDIQIMGLFWAVAFGWFSWQVYTLIKKDAQEAEFFEHHFWRWTVVGLLTGRLFVLLINPNILESYGWTSLFAVWEGKINVYAFLLGFLGFMWWDMRNTKHSFWRYLDIGVIPFLKVALFVDIAFFITGAIYGNPTTLPWGVRYETFGVDLITPLHPVSIYALIGHWLLFRWVKKRKNSTQKNEGQLFTLAMVGFVLIDFLIQFLRSDLTWYLGGIRVNQILAFILLIGLVFLYERKWKWSRLWR